MTVNRILFIALPLVLISLAVLFFLLPPRPMPVATPPIMVTDGLYQLTFSHDGFADQSLPLNIPAPGDWIRSAVLPTGRSPKQVSFTPDGRYLVVTLLDDDGFDLIDLHQNYQTVRVVAPQAAQKGYVESLMCPEKHTFWISQMTTNMLYEYSLPSITESRPILQRSLKAHGVWTKVLSADAQYRFLAVANWVSNSVAILDYTTGALLANLTGLAVPRGLAFSPDGAYLYIASYEGGTVYKYATVTWQSVSNYKSSGSAMRHIVLSADGAHAWVSDMATRSVKYLDTAAMTLLKTFTVDSHPNTIALSADESRLFVSCRGPNNPQSYLLRSPVNGTIHIFNLQTGLRETILNGGNQPTGLALSPDGKTLAFTNFMDNNLEIYRRVERWEWTLNNRLLKKELG